MCVWGGACKAAQTSWHNKSWGNRATDIEIVEQTIEAEEERGDETHNSQDIPGYLQDMEQEGYLAMQYVESEP